MFAENLKNRHGSRCFIEYGVLISTSHFKSFSFCFHVLTYTDIKYFVTGETCLVKKHKFTHFSNFHIYIIIFFALPKERIRFLGKSVMNKWMQYFMHFIFSLKCQ